jgi:hypothetical protein
MRIKEFILCGLNYNINSIINHLCNIPKGGGMTRLVFIHIESDHLREFQDNKSVAKAVAKWQLKEQVPFSFI